MWEISSYRRPVLGSDVPGFLVGAAEETSCGGAEDIASPDSGIPEDVVGDVALVHVDGFKTDDTVTVFVNAGGKLVSEVTKWSNKTGDLLVTLECSSLHDSKEKENEFLHSHKFRFCRAP